MYNSILDGCAKQHRVDEDLQVLDEMKASGISPSNYALSILVKVLGHARRLPRLSRWSRASAARTASGRMFKSTLAWCRLACTIGGSRRLWKTCRPRCVGRRLDM
jgi:pentatricopeptide repeat protein